jgi:phosphatidylinositol alpha-mannosyltransferase
MRILQVCPYDLARPGGVQRHIIDLSHALVSSGHDVTIVAPDSPDSGQTPNLCWPRSAPLILHLGAFRTCRIHGTSFEISRASRAQLQSLLDLHRRNPFDVVHFHTPWTPFMSWQVFRAVCPLIARRIATFHDTPPPTLSGRIMRSLFRLLSRRISMQLDVIVAVSDSPAAHLRPRADCRLVRLPPCIDLEAYRALTVQAHRGRPIRLLFVGRLEPRKGILLLIDAFAQLQRHHGNTELVVCGDGEQGPIARARAAALGIASSVLFTGALPETAKLKQFADADIFCAPSPYGESYGLVIAEAMSAGLPVVAAANTGYSTLLTGNGAEGLVTPGNCTALAEKLAVFVESPDLRQRLSLWGRTESRHSDVYSRLPEFTALYAGVPRNS